MTNQTIFSKCKHISFIHCSPYQFVRNLCHYAATTTESAVRARTRVTGTWSCVPRVAWLVDARLVLRRGCALGEVLDSKKCTYAQWIFVWTIEWSLTTTCERRSTNVRTLLKLETLCQVFRWSFVQFTSGESPEAGALPFSEIKCTPLVVKSMCFPKQRERVWWRALILDKAFMSFRFLDNASLSVSTHNLINVPLLGECSDDSAIGLRTYKMLARRFLSKFATACRAKNKHQLIFKRPALNPLLFDNLWPRLNKVRLKYTRGMSHFQQTRKGKVHVIMQIRKRQ